MSTPNADKATRNDSAPPPTTGDPNASGRDTNAPTVVPVRSHRGNVTIPIRNARGEAEDLVLVAGPNMVAADKWAAAKAQPGVRRLLADRIKPTKALEQNQLVVGKCALVEGQPVPAAAPLSGMSDTDAIEMVNDISDANLLTRLQASESRATVRRAITARQEQLRDPSKVATAAEAAAGMGRAQITME